MRQKIEWIVKKKVDLYDVWKSRESERNIKQKPEKLNQIKHGIWQQIEWKWRIREKMLKSTKRTFFKWKIKNIRHVHAWFHIELNFFICFSRIETILKNFVKNFFFQPNISLKKHFNFRHCDHNEIFRYFSAPFLQIQIIRKKSKRQQKKARKIKFLTFE